MVPERKPDCDFVNDKEIHSDSNVLSTGQRWKRDKDLMLSLNEIVDDFLWLAVFVGVVM